MLIYKNLILRICSKFGFYDNQIKLKVFQNEKVEQWQELWVGRLLLATGFFVHFEYPAKIVLSSYIERPS
jgi:hypothetical protein